jgi:hypothetical protein
MVNVVGILYPALYAYLVEVPVEPPGVIPPGTCVTSEVRSRCSVTAEVSCRPKVESCGVEVWQSPIPPSVDSLVMECGIEVRQAIECETIECRSLVTSECVAVSYPEDAVEEVTPKVIAEVTVKYLGSSAIGCTNPKVTAGVSVRTRMVAEVLTCACRSQS